jgi:hypothetical protein
MDDVHATELEIVALQLELAEQPAHELSYRQLVIRRAGTAEHLAEAPKTA